MLGFSGRLFAKGRSIGLPVRYIGGVVPLPEKPLIAQIRRMARSVRARKARRPSPGNVVAGIGDDCAILRLPAAKDSLVTTDFSLEGIHFRRDWHPPESVGHRCLVRGLSDIAAMGGEPLAAFLSLALPRDLPQAWVARFARSLISVAKRLASALPEATLPNRPAESSPTSSWSVLSPKERPCCGRALGSATASSSAESLAALPLPSCK